MMINRLKLQAIMTVNMPRATQRLSLRIKKRKEDGRNLAMAAVHCMPLWRDISTKNTDEWKVLHGQIDDCGRNITASFGQV